MRGLVMSLCVLGWLAGCAPPEDTSPPVVVAAADAEPTLHWSADLDGKRVAVDGYVNLDNGPTGAGIARGPQLTSQPGGRGTALINFEVERGTGPGQLDLPVMETRVYAQFPTRPEVDRVDMSRASYRDAAGVAYPISRKVRVTGRLAYARWSGGQLFSNEDKRSTTGRRLMPRLIDVVLEPAP